MPEARHANQRVIDGIHIPHSFEYADQVARVAASGFTAEDLHKWAIQLDNGSLWRLIDISPVTWKEIASVIPVSARALVVAAGAFTTINAAITAALALSPPPDSANPAVIQVYPGVYTEAPFTVPGGVNLISLAGAGSAIIATTVVTGIAVTVEATAFFSGFTVIGASGAGGVGILFSGAGFSAVTGVFVRNCETAAKATGAGTIALLDNFLVTRVTGETLDTAIFVESGAEMRASNLSLTGQDAAVQIDHGIHVVGSGTQLTMSNAFIRHCNHALHVDDSAKLEAFSTIINGFTDIGLHIGPTGGSVAHTTGVDIDSTNTTLDLWIESATAVLNTTGGTFRKDKILVAVGATMRGSFFSPIPGDEGTVIVGESAVGLHDQGFESIFGEGDSHTVGMIVFTNDNLEVGSWVDETADAASALGSTFLSHPGIVAGNCVYVGGDLPFGGIKLNTTVASVLGAGSLILEYWDGAWVELLTMATKADDPYTQYANTPFERNDFEQVRAGLAPGWVKKVLNGENKFWIRSRVVVGITSVATVEQVKLHTNRTELNANGFEEYFGTAEPARDLVSGLAALVDIVAASPANESLNVSANIDINTQDNKFVNGAVDQRGAKFTVPAGLDTSKPVIVEFLWQEKASNTGDVEWELFQSDYVVGGDLDGTNIEASFSEIVVIAVSAPGEVRKLEFTLDLSRRLPGDEIVVSLRRDATGPNGDDTYGGAVYLSGFRVHGRFWH